MSFERDALIGEILLEVGRMTLTYQSSVDILRNLVEDLSEDDNEMLQERIALLEGPSFPVITSLDPCDPICLCGCAVDVVDQLLDRHIDFLLEHDNARLADFKTRLDAVRVKYPHSEERD